ncbi:MAG: MFS transporter [Chloroflexi bacterium]|nr:MFS transporter [Chloroflexota bacterium]
MKERLSTLDQLTLSLFWFATNFLWGALLIVTIPSQVLLMVGDAYKGTGMGWVIGAGAFIALIFPPLVGALSDRARFALGRRRPCLIVGVVVNCLALLGMAYFPRAGDMASFTLYIVAFLFVEFGNNVATAPYSAMIPDRVPEEQRGAASGWMGLMTMLGTVGGVAVAGALTGPSTILLYWLIIGILLAAMAITVFAVKEEPVSVTKPFVFRQFLRGLWISPKVYPDFAWVFLTRLLVMMGIYTVQEFLQYYLKDVIQVFAVLGNVLTTEPEGAVAVLILALMAGAILSTLTAGVLSDRVGRKRMIYLSGALMSLVAAVFILTQSFTIALLMGLVFGLGYGAYMSVDWALACDVLPSADHFAKDMGIWHIATVFPQVIAVPIAGPLLDNFQRVGKASGYLNLGYVVIFIIAIMYFALGTYFVSRIKRAR